MQTYPYRWGVIAPGKIAKKFVEGIRALHGSYIHAVASRNAARAQSFAEFYDIPGHYDSYEALVKDPDIDIIYIASPHNFHFEQAKLSLENGKHVLVEKPLGINLSQVTALIELARARNLFLQEAMWTRFLPVMRQVRSWLEDGTIGEVRHLSADFNFRSGTWDLSDRKFNPDLAGGALLDVGIYPVALAHMVFDMEPAEVRTVANLGETGVDFQSAYLFRYPQGQIATLTSGFEAHGSKEAVISGTKGHIRIPLFWRGNEAILSIDNGEPQNYVFPYDSSGLQFQAEQMMRDLFEKKKESTIMPHRASLSIMGVMDQIRHSWGLTYPGE